MSLQNYTVDISQVTQESINLSSNCNSIMFINKGAPIIYIENFPLAGGESFVIDGNAGEICTRTFTIKNNTSGGLWVVRKTYTK